MTRRVFHLQLAAVGVALILAGIAGGVGSAQAPRAVSIDGDDIGGVVTGPHGPEAGVWVVAETTDLPTRLIKSVVTDDQGRYRAAGPAEGELRRLGARLRSGGFAEDKGDAGQQLALKAVPAPSRARPPSTTRRSTGCRCCRCRRRATSPAPARRATASRRT